MKRSIIILALTIGLGFAFQKSSADEIPPTCDYVHCPGGASNCCSEGGVTLFNWNPPQQ